MKRIVRGKSVRRRPTAIEAHTWTPEEIRAKPEGAFHLFDLNKDGVVTVAELLFTARKTNAETRRRGSIFDEMKLFEVMDVNGDAVVTLEEFCSVVADKDALSDEALGAIAKMATRAAETNATEDDEDDEDSAELDAAAGTMGLVQGLALQRSQGALEAPESPRSKALRELDDECQCVLELIAVGVAPNEYAWYDPFHLSTPTASSPFVVLVGEKNGKVVELGRTTTVWDSSAAAWPPVALERADLAALDRPYKVSARLYCASSHTLLGETPVFDVGAVQVFDVDLTKEVALGPYFLTDHRDDVTAKLIGTRKWAKVDPSLGRANRESRDLNFCVVTQQDCVAYCAFNDIDHTNPRLATANASLGDIVPAQDLTDMRAVATKRAAAGRH